MSLAKLARQIKKENKEKNRTIEELFIATLDDFLVKSRLKKAESRKFRPAFNPSSVYKCQRQLWYKLLGFTAKEKTYARSIRILENGAGTHEWVQEDVLMEINEDDQYPLNLIPLEEIPSYGKNGIEFIREHSAAPTEVKFIDHRFTREIPISAMCDGVFEFMNKQMIFEFKTINPDDFKVLIEPLRDHVKQGALYALCLGIHRVMFLYYNKGNSEWKAFLVEYKKEQLDWIVNRLQTIEGYVIREELPPKEESDQCQWCPFKHLCEKDISEKEPQ